MPDFDSSQPSLIALRGAHAADGHSIERSSTLQAIAAMAPGLRWMIGSVIASVAIAALYFGREILMPLALALLLGFVLDPMVTRLKRWGIPRVLAVLVVVVATLTLLGTGGYVVGTQARDLSAELPTYQQNIRMKLRHLRQHFSGPGVLDGLFKTVTVVQTEVESPVSGVRPSGSSGIARADSAVQRVQVEDKPVSPFKTAMAWIEAAIGPLATAGIVLVFVVLVLLDRQDLRDRLVRLMGGSLHRSTDAMDEAGERIGKYLRMQLLVNVSYGIPMGLGLWIIGVPGALLWGALAAVMRFVPYVGPMISALFPLALAFAIDPGWNLVLWTVGLIVALELLSNNIVEPLVYGSSTGLSAMSIMVSATFWTALWGPMGLIMATPLTVCLLVVGRYLPALKFLDILLGSQPALNPPTRFYQRLLADDADDAVEMATQAVESGGSVAAFYDDIAIPALRMAVEAHGGAASAEHRLRLVDGMAAILKDLQEQYPSTGTPGEVRVVCLGGKWEVDELAAYMQAHAFSLNGIPARVHACTSTDVLADLDLRGVDIVCLNYLSPDPSKAAKALVRRIKRRWPQVRVVLALWNSAQLSPIPQGLSVTESTEGGPTAAIPRWGDVTVVESISGSVVELEQMMGTSTDTVFTPAPVPDGDALRVEALHASGALRSEPMQRLFTSAAKRAADVFDVPFAMVSLVDRHRQITRASYGALDGPNTSERHQSLEAGLPRDQAPCSYVVADSALMCVTDVSRDTRFAGNPSLRQLGIGFYAGAPLKDASKNVWGTLCLMDSAPRKFDRREQRLLQAMAQDLMVTVQQIESEADIPTGVARVPESNDGEAPSASVGQVVPT